MNNDVYNEHLNIFNYYSRGKTCEDNLSRILARILLEEKYKDFHKELLNLIGLAGNIDYVFSHVGFNAIKKYINDNNINIYKCIPVTLTDREQNVDNTPIISKRSIPDIVLLSNGKLIFIEVKLGTTVPEEQVIRQIQDYLGDKTYNVKVERITWEEIIKILSKLYIDDFFIKDYLQIIDSSYSNWFQYNFNDIYTMKTTKKDSNGNIVYKEERDFYDKNNLINIRISRLLEDYCKKNNIRLHSHFYRRRAFPLINAFTTEMQLRFNQNHNSLDAHIWTGERVSYTKEFNQYYKNNSKLIHEFIDNKENKYGAKYYIIPYVLFRDHFGYLNEVNIDKLMNTFIPERICNILCGRRKYVEFVEIINNNRDEIEKYIRHFVDYFEYIGNKYYLNSKRTNLTISIGYDVVISYPKDIYFKLDDENKLDFIVDDCIETFKKYFGTVVRK